MSNIYGEVYHKKCAAKHVEGREDPRRLPSYSGPATGSGNQAVPSSLDFEDLDSNGQTVMGQSHSKDRWAAEREPEPDPRPKYRFSNAEPLDDFLKEVRTKSTRKQIWERN
jgi:hypothetical protein